MKKSTLAKLSLAASVLAISAFSGQSHAATYYACEAGYSFQVKNSAVRCYIAPKVKTVNPLPCQNVTIAIINKSVGHFLRTDKVGRADKCVGSFKVGPVTNENVLDLACPSGYKLQIKSGKDTCRKTIPAQYKAPTRAVNR